MSTSTAETDDNSPLVLLRPDVWSQRMADRGYPSPDAQAVQVGCDRSTMYRLIGRQIGPRGRTARRMSKAAGLPLAELFELADR